MSQSGGKWTDTVGNVHTVCEVWHNMCRVCAYVNNAQNIQNMHTTCAPHISFPAVSRNVCSFHRGVLNTEGQGGILFPFFSGGVSGRLPGPPLCDAGAGGPLAPPLAPRAGFHRVLVRRKYALGCPHQGFSVS